LSFSKSPPSISGISSLQYIPFSFFLNSFIFSSQLFPLHLSPLSLSLTL
jgi:hypothetical protein